MKLQVIMEMTGSFDLDKPILLTAVVAFGFSRRFGLNIYDSGSFCFIQVFVFECRVVFVGVVLLLFLKLTIKQQ